MEKLLAFLKDEEGATAIEYGLIAALIAAFIIVALKFLGESVSGAFNKIAEAVKSAVP